ncbi:hypothetical protein BSKO_06694 [Bryopsis sp. KO-2023]|nr:hypothetical protein BSKO_06694 [Bryopsis sp. KO-2023]
MPVDVYVDEEDLLGFHVFVAELELLWGNRRGDRALDSGVLLELLQKIVVSIDRTKQDGLRQFQRRCETVLSGILLLGVCSEVRQLICKCLSKLYRQGDSLPMYSQVGVLEGYLSSKEALSRKSSESSKLGALECLTYLSQEHGTRMLSTLPAFVSTAAKHAQKGSNSIAVRVAAIRLVAAAVQALGADRRSGKLVQEEALKLAEKFWKPGQPEEIRLGCFMVLSSIARAGGAVLWLQGGYSFDESVKVCVTGLEDSSQAVRIACGEALGELATAAKSSSAIDAVHQETRAARRTALEKILSQNVQRCIIRPFVEAAVFNRKDTCAALARSWVAYISSISAQQVPPDENDIVEIALQIVGTLAAASGAYNEAKAKGLLEDQIELGSGLSSGELPVAQAAVLYVLRVGILRRLSETSQRQLADKLVALLASIVGGASPLAIGALGGVQLLLEVLGEIPDETGRMYEVAVLEKLVSGSSAVRSQAAATLGSIARADPGCVAKLVSTLIEYLRVSADQLASLSAPYGASHPLPWSLIPGSPGSPHFDGKKDDAGTSIRHSMHAVYGHSLGLAAVLVASRYTPLGVPSKLYTDALRLAEDLILSPKSPVANAQAVEQKAGHSILGALCVAIPEELLKIEGDMLPLWEPAFGTLAKNTLMDKSYMRQNRDIDLAMQLWWRSAALESLHAYIKGILSKGLVPGAKAQFGRIALLLSPIVDAMALVPGFQDPARAVGGPGGWVAGTVATLQLRLLEVYSLLPAGAGIQENQEALLKLCSKALRTPTALLSSGGVSELVSSITLYDLLDPEDKPLGPWRLDEEPLDEELEMMSGEKGAPQLHPWEAGMGVWRIEMAVGKGGASIRCDTRPSPFPQSKSLGLALIEIQLRVLGQVLSRAATKNKIQVIDLLINVCKKIHAAKDFSKIRPLLACVCCAGLSGLQNARKRGSVGRSDEVAQRIGNLAYAILDQSSGSEAFRRSAGQLIGCAVLHGTDSFVIRFVKQICSDIKASNSNDRRSGLAFGLGCIFRAKGGMSLQSVIPLGIDTLFSLISRPTADVHFWAFHGLLLSANAAGLAYMPYVRKSLQLGKEIMTSQLQIAKLRPFVGRMTNAMVAVLGPELTPGGKDYIVCKLLMRQMEAGVSHQSLIDAAQTTAAALELVLYAQQLVLFAPQAVPAKRHIPMLLEVFRSPHPSLRYAAATTLRQLVERDPASLCQHAIEVALFNALDKESEIHITNAIQATLSAMQNAQCPMNPHRWISVCSDIVLGTQKDRSGRETGDGVERGVESLMAGSDEEEIDGRQDSFTSGLTTISDKGNVWGDCIPSPRLKTRLFACQILLDIFVAVGKTAEHFDLVKAMRSQEAKWLVLKVQDLVKLGFSLATGQVEALRPFGVQVLTEIIDAFSAADDPMQEGSKLLFQFQAQFVSPLRLALSIDAPPLLFMRGSTLAVSFLKSGLAGGDVIVLKQLMGLLVAPMQEWQKLQYENCSEWVGARVRVSLLEAHAHCTSLADEGTDEVSKEIVKTAQGPIVKLLQTLWYGMLLDYTVLSRWQSKVWETYMPNVITVGNQSGSELDMKTLEDAWPVALQALSRNLPSAEDVKNDSTQISHGLDLPVQHASSAVAGVDEDRTPQSVLVSWAPMEPADGMEGSDEHSGSKQSETVTGGETDGASGEQEQGNKDSPATSAGTPSEEASQLEDRQKSSGDASTSHSASASASDTGSSTRHLASINVRLDNVEGGLNCTPSELYWRLLDIATAQLGVTAMRAVEQFRSEDGASAGEVNLWPLLVCIGALQELLSGPFVALEVCPVGICVEVLEMLVSVLQQVVHPLLCSGEKLSATGLLKVVSSTASLLNGMCCSATPSMYKRGIFGQALMDCILCCTSILSSDMQNNPTTDASNCIESGLAATFSAVSCAIKSCSWELVSAWMGTVLQQALHTMGGEHSRNVFLAIKECIVCLCQSALASKESENTTEDIDPPSPQGMVLWTCSNGLQELEKWLGVAESEQSPSYEPRCLCLLWTLFELASLTKDYMGDCQTVRDFHENLILLLMSSFSTGKSEVVLHVVLEALRVFFQEQQGTKGLEANGKQRWGIFTLSRLGPSVACIVQRMLAQGQGALSGRELQVVVESLKLYFVSVNLVEGGSDGQTQILQVLVPLMVEVAGLQTMPALVDMVVKLINHLNAGNASVAFKRVVAGLSPGCKQKFQMALRSVAEVGSVGRIPQGPVLKPTIQKQSIVLKTNFTFPKQV